jgi:hypothetical protein
MPISRPLLFIDLFCVFVCQNVMEQFNPGLRNLINLGKNYEKAVNGKSFDFLMD